MTIRRHIVYGYALVLGVALVGTITGLAVGTYHQRRALQYRQTATEERQLLTDLQVNILYNRPAKQLAPHLDDRDRFQAESQNLLERVRAIQVMLQDYQNLQSQKLRLPGGEAMQNDILAQQLADYATVVEEFRVVAQGFVREVNALTDTPEDRETARRSLLSFVQSPEFTAFIEFPDQIAPFQAGIEAREQAAEAALHRAEDLRMQIIIGSLVLSMAIAALIALYSSQAIARPVKAVTQVAQRITDENNFDLQITVESHDEMEILANTLNQLIRQVKQLLNELGQKNADLNAAFTQLHHQQIHLIQTEKMSSLGQLVAGVAHEINNPVNFIHGNLPHVQQYAEDLLNIVQLYQKHYPEPVAEIQTEAEQAELDFIQEDLVKTLNSMQLGTERIREIVLSLRNFSRIDEAEFKEVNLHDGIDSTLLILQHRLKDKPDRPAIRIMKDYGNLPLVECYAGQMNQVFMNVLVNAIDALEEVDSQRTYQEIQANPGQIRIRTAVVGTQWIEVAIADNGPGIPDDILPRIFDPFFTTKPLGKGTGMGMPISYQIVTEKHGGKLECISSPEKGTEFIIQIPTQQP